MDWVREVFLVLLKSPMTKIYKAFSTLCLCKALVISSSSSDSNISPKKLLIWRIICHSCHLIDKFRPYCSSNNKTFSHRYLKMKPKERIHSLDLQNNQETEQNLFLKIAEQRIPLFHSRFPRFHSQVLEIRHLWPRKTLRKTRAFSTYILLRINYAVR